MNEAAISNYAGLFVESFKVSQNEAQADFEDLQENYIQYGQLIQYENYTAVSNEFLEFLGDFQKSQVAFCDYTAYCPDDLNGHYLGQVLSYFSSMVATIFPMQYHQAEDIFFSKEGRKLSIFFLSFNFIL